MDKQSLCLCYLMGEATEEQAAELSRWIAESPKNAEAFALLAAQDAYLNTAVAKNCRPSKESASLLEELAELDRMSEPAQLVDVTDAVVEQQRLEQERMRLQAERGDARGAGDDDQHRLIVVIPKAAVWLGLAAAVALAATLLFYITPPTPQTAQTPGPAAPKVAPPIAGPAFATVVRELDAEWEDASDQAGLLREGKHRLLNGAVQIELLSGTRLVIQAPASFELNGVNRMDLEQGRVVAFVPKASSGFVLETPNARFVETGFQTDATLGFDHPSAKQEPTLTSFLSEQAAYCTVNPLPHAGSSPCIARTQLVSTRLEIQGTEFGVRIDRDLKTLVQVFRGEIHASPLIDHEPVGEPTPIAQAEAAVVASNGAALSFVEFDEYALQRELTTRLALVDMIMGGDGTTSRQNIGLHPLTGKYVRNVAGNKALIGIFSSGRARPVAGSPYVSRVFIPSKDGRIDGLPTGLKLPNLPKTNGIGYGVIWSGAEMPSLDGNNLVSVQTKLPGYNFAGAGQQSMVMHTNVGFVIDLDAIRRAKPGFEIVAIKAVVGNSSTYDNSEAKLPMRSAFLTYLDSDLVSHEVFDLSDPDRERVTLLDLPIEQTNRYLTFVSADGGDGNHQDWIVLGNPLVVLRPIENLYQDF